MTSISERTNQTIIQETVQSQIFSKKDFLGRICSYLIVKDLGSVACVNKNSKEGVAAGLVNAPNLINKLIISCAKKLNCKGYSDQALTLKQITFSINLTGCQSLNLKIIKSLVERFKPNISKVLKDIPKKTVDEMLANDNTWFMDDLGLLTDIERAYAISDPGQRNEAFLQLGKSLCKLGNGRCEIVKGSLVTQYKANALQNYAEILKDVQTWPEDNLKKNICKGFANQKKFDLAIDLADLITNKAEQNHAVQQICISLAQDKQFDRAIALADKITNMAERNHAVQQICIFLAQDNQIDRAIELSNQIIELIRLDIEKRQRDLEMISSPPRKQE